MYKTPALIAQISHATLVQVFGEEGIVLSFLWLGVPGMENSGLNKGALLRFEPRHV